MYQSKVSTNLEQIAKTYCRKLKMASRVQKSGNYAPELCRKSLTIWWFEQKRMEENLEKNNNSPSPENCTLWNKILQPVVHQTTDLDEKGTYGLIYVPVFTYVNTSIISFYIRWTFQPILLLGRQLDLRIQYNSTTRYPNPVAPSPLLSWYTLWERWRWPPEVAEIDHTERHHEVWLYQRQEVVRWHGYKS